MSDPFVANLVGSKSDLEFMQAGADILRSRDVPCESKITSTLRTPANSQSYMSDAESSGYDVFNAGAGLAAQILSLTDEALTGRLKQEREQNVKKVLEQDRSLQP